MMLHPKTGAELEFKLGGDGIDIKCDGVCFTVNGQPLAVSDTKSLTDKLFSQAFGR